MTPRNIIDNLPHIDFKDLLYEFGQYVQLHVDDSPTNTMRSRTIGAIVLGPRSIQGKYNYMSLETGMKIDGRVVGILPITPEVINRVETLGKKPKSTFQRRKDPYIQMAPRNPIYIYTCNLLITNLFQIPSDGNSMMTRKITSIMKFKERRPNIMYEIDRL